MARRFRAILGHVLAVQIKLSAPPDGATAGVTRLLATPLTRSLIGRLEVADGGDVTLTLIVRELHSESTLEDDIAGAICACTRIWRGIVDP